MANIDEEILRVLEQCDEETKQTQQLDDAEQKFEEQNEKFITKFMQYLHTEAQINQSKTEDEEKDVVKLSSDEESESSDEEIESKNDEKQIKIPEPIQEAGAYIMSCKNGLFWKFRAKHTLVEINKYTQKIKNQLKNVKMPQQPRNLLGNVQYLRSLKAALPMNTILVITDEAMEMETQVKNGKTLAGHYNIEVINAHAHEVLGQVPGIKTQRLYMATTIHHQCKFSCQKGKCYCGSFAECSAIKVPTYRLTGYSQEIGFTDNVQGTIDTIRVVQGNCVECVYMLLSKSFEANLTVNPNVQLSKKGIYKLKQVREAYDVMFKETAIELRKGANDAGIMRPKWLWYLYLFFKQKNAAQDAKEVYKIFNDAICTRLLRTGYNVNRKTFDVLSFKQRPPVTCIHRVGSVCFKWKILHYSSYYCFHENTCRSTKSIYDWKNSTVDYQQIHETDFMDMKNTNVMSVRNKRITSPYAIRQSLQAKEKRRPTAKLFEKLWHKHYYNKTLPIYAQMMKDFEKMHKKPIGRNTLGTIIRQDFEDMGYKRVTKMCHGGPIKFIKLT
eukprot:144602_1